MEEMEMALDADMHMQGFRDVGHKRCFPCHNHKLNIIRNHCVIQSCCDRVYSSVIVCVCGATQVDCSDWLLSALECEGCGCVRCVQVVVLQGERKIATDHHLLRVASVKSLASLLSNVAGLFAHEFIVHASS